MIILVKNKHTLQIDEFKFKCCIGKNGATKNKKEGDKKTPKGTFKIENLYYRRDRVNKPETFLKCVEIKNNMGWCDDVNFPTKYNKRIKISKKIKQITETLKVNVAAESYPFLKFWKAEKYHQDFKKNNKFNSYIINVSDPRFKRFKYKFSEIIKQNQ